MKNSRRIVPVTISSLALWLRSVAQIGACKSMDSHNVYYVKPRTFRKCCIMPESWALKLSTFTYLRCSFQKSPFRENSKT